MTCGGCAARRELIGQAATATSRGAWQEAASAARAAAASARTDLVSVSQRVAQAAAAALARRGGR